MDAAYINIRGVLCKYGVFYSGKEDTFGACWKF